MATTHFSRTVHKQSARKGRSVAGVRYILRQEEQGIGQAKARVQHLDQAPAGGKTREDFVAGRAENLPAWAPDAVTYFSLAEQYERGGHRKAGVVSTEWRFSLPRELSREDQLAAGKDVMQALLGDDHPYVWGMHDKTAMDGGAQPHMHCLWSRRRLDGIDRDPVQFFRQYHGKDPAKGGAQKDPLLGAMGQAKRERQAYTDIMNFYLERAGCAARLDPRKLVERGITRHPEPRLEPFHSNKARYQHEMTGLWQQVLAHRAALFPQRHQEQALAQRYWTRRKEELGIVPGRQIDRDAFVALIAARTQEEARTSRPQRTEEELQTCVLELRAEVARLEAYAAQVEAARTGQAVAPAALVALLAGRGLDEARPRRGFHVTLYDQETTYGR